MDGLVTAATAYVGSSTHPQLTFSYAPAEIQGAAESAGIRQVQQVHHVHTPQQHVQHGVGLPVVGAPQMIAMSTGRPSKLALEAAGWTLFSVKL